MIADAQDPRTIDPRDANTTIRTRPAGITGRESEKTDTIPGETIIATSTGTEVSDAATMTDPQGEIATYLMTEEVVVAEDAAAVIVVEVDEKIAMNSLRKHEAGKTVLLQRSESLHPT